MGGRTCRAAYELRPVGDVGDQMRADELRLRSLQRFPVGGRQRAEMHRSQCCAALLKKRLMLCVRMALSAPDVRGD
jgi:hypothetical protein